MNNLKCALAFFEDDSEMITETSIYKTTKDQISNLAKVTRRVGQLIDPLQISSNECSWFRSQCTLRIVMP